MEDIGKILKNARSRAGLKVQEVSEKMLNMGHKKALPKTIYSWESGNSQPSPDYFLSLCMIYGISDILYEFGYKTERMPTSEISLSEETEKVVKAYEKADTSTQSAVRKILDVELEGVETWSILRNTKEA